MQELNTSAKFCTKTISLGEDNAYMYADISRFTATPLFCLGMAANFNLLMSADKCYSVYSPEN